MLVYYLFDMGKREKKKKNIWEMLEIDGLILFVNREYGGELMNYIVLVIN